MKSELVFSKRKEGDKKQSKQDIYVNMVSFALKVEPELIKTYLRISTNPINLGKLDLQDIYAESEKKEVKNFYKDLFHIERYLKLKKLINKSI